MSFLFCIVNLFAALYATKVNVMLPLTTVSNNGVLNEDVCRSFGILKNAGVYGVMVDVWWGIVEQSPKSYNFAAYQRLADICQQNGLKLQVVMSFHQCGGSVGDDCNIPIPSWVRNVNDVWYRDANGHDEKVYIGLHADDEPVFNGRTAIQIYTDFMTAFTQAMGSRMGSTINEVQVGVGPCGELRYTGYIEGLWRFPGIGMFQAFAPKMIAMFQNASRAAGHPEWDSPPRDAGSYNSRPDETSFFKSGGGYQSEFGKFFTAWYSNLLIEHARKILTPACKLFHNVNTEVAMKVAGIHWWYNHESHAAEMTTGYANGYGITQPSLYDRAAQLCKELNVILDFTCFEMHNHEQDSSAGCNPEGLVNQVLTVVRNNGIKVSAENALARYDDYAYDKIIQNSCNLGTKVEAFTYLRLTDQLVYNNDNLNRFKRLVSSLSRC